MMCLMSKLEKTVQGVTQDIIDIMSLNEFPQIPFIMKGYFGGNLRKLEILESDVFFYHDLIELWYIDRKNISWVLNNIQFAQRILLNLKWNKIRSYPLISIEGEIKLSIRYYEKLLESYITKLSIIKYTLIKWLKFLFLLENKRSSRSGIHHSLKSFTYNH